MPNLKNVIARYRNSRSAYLALWCIIALGIVPAIITQSIFPLDIFSLQFGIEITGIAYLPGLVGLIVFVSGVFICIVQKRFLTIVLLLPWLALYGYEVDELTFQLPTYSQVQEQLRENYNWVQEGSDTPSTNEIRSNLDQVVYAKIELMPFDVEAVRSELNSIDAQLDIKDTGLDARAKKISSDIANKSRQITRTNTQISAINQAKKTTEWIYRISLGLSDRHLQTELLRGLKKVTAHRNRLVSERNGLRATLDGIAKSKALKVSAYERLLELHAEVKTYLWVSQSYQAWYTSLVYKSLCFLVLLVLIWKFALSSWVFLLTVFGSLLVSLLYVDAPISFRLWVVIKFLIIAIVIRSIYRLAFENYPVIHNQSRAFLLQTLKTTFKYYSPFVILIALGIFASIYVNRLIDEKLYAVEVMNNSDLSSNTRRFDIDIAIDTYFDNQEKSAHGRLDILSTKAGLSANDVAAKTVAIYEDSFKPELPQMNPAFEEPACDHVFHWIFKPGDCVEKEIKHPINVSYGDMREEQLGNLQRSSSAYAQRANNNAQAAIRIAKRDLSENFRAIRLAVKTQLSHVYTAIDFYAWVSLLVLIFVTLKSFLYIFARIFFASDKYDEKRAIQFEMAPQPKQKGRVKEVPGKLKLTAKMGDQMYLNKDFDFANAPPDEVTPQAHKAFFSRFKNRVWHMNRVKTAARGKKKNAPYCRIPDDERIVVWRLKPGDSVVFSWKTFVGMSEAITIRTQFSWQLSSLVFGRMFFIVASVDADSPTDGSLLLIAKGSDGIDDSSNPSNSPDQLLAWQTTTRFQLHANLNFRNVYRSGVQIKASDSDLAVMHLNSSKRKSGVATFLKYFLIPV